MCMCDSLEFKFQSAAATMCKGGFRSSHRENERERESSITKTTDRTKELTD